MKNKTPTDQEKTQLIAIRDDAIAGFVKHQADFELLEQGYVNIIPNDKRLNLIKRGKSTITPNLILPKVSMVVRDVMKSFFANDELANLSVEDGADEEDKKVNEALKKELKEYSREAKLYSITKPAVRDSLIYGTAINKVYWSKRDNTAKVEQCKIDSVFLDPYAPNSDDLRFLVHRVNSMTIADLEEKYSDMSIDWEQYADDSLIGTNTLSQNDEIGKYQRVEIYDVYRKKGAKWYLSTILTDDVILAYDTPLKDGLPFIVSNIDPQFVMLNEPITPVRAYGSSFIAPLIPLQQEYTIKRNQQIDAIDVQLSQRFLVGKQSGLREDDLLSNRKKIAVDDVSSVKELQIPKINDATFSTQLLAQEAEEISGVTKFSQGVDGGGREKTAREVMALQSQGSSVTDDINRAFNENFFRPLVHKIVNLIYKYKDASVALKDLDRTKILKQKVIINVGVGSTNKMLSLDNNDNAIGAVNMAIQTFMGLQDTQRVQKYSFMFDALVNEKLKLLNQDSVIEEVEVKTKEMQAQQETQAQQQIQISEQGALQ